MFSRLRRRRSREIYEIAPEEIFLDSTNLAQFDASAFSGRMVKPVANRAIFAVGVVFAAISIVFCYRAFSLQIAHGDTYADISENNTLDRDVIFATRGILYDRNGRELAWNEALIATTTASSTLPQKEDETFALRKYTRAPGMAVLLGYLQYPKADAHGNWWREEYSGVSGLELSLDSTLRGENGSRMIESDAHGTVERENIVSPAVHGQDVRLSIDADVQSKLYEIMHSHAERMGFKGGAAIIMDVHTGELLAITSFPEYDNQAFADGDVAKVRDASGNARSPMLNRAVGGLYTPGSIVKPIFAIAALNEHIATPQTSVQSTGKLVLPNPYDPSNPSIFRDWAVHGWIDMRTAIAVSSDEYFYTIGGGFGGQKGLGIAKIDEYARRFGLAQKTGIDMRGEVEGIIPTPEWKERVFDGDPWRIGDTYHTAIGQYGFQITPIQAVRFTAAIANGGTLLKPQIVASSSPVATQIGIPDEYIQVAREGMRIAVVSDRFDATVKSLNIGGIMISAKTGTAQLGSHNEYMNSWSIGFWPSDNPRYAYAAVLEKAPAGTLSGAAPGLRPFFEWLIANHPEYVH